MKESTAKPSSGQARSSEVARALLRRTKQASRRRFPAEEKIRILLEGIRAEISVAELCRREGIHPTVYYTWLKDFMEAGKARMRAQVSPMFLNEFSRGVRRGGAAARGASVAGPSRAGSAPGQACYATAS